jgi:two-component system cell cycle response regulator DivK
MSAHILVVDDDEKSLKLACDVLEHGGGYRVTRAGCGEDALALAGTAVCDLALLDIQLPGISGVETFKALRALPGWGAVPVIAMTASVMPDERSKLVREGFDGFLSKPLPIKELLLRVKAALTAERT